MFAPTRILRNVALAIVLATASMPAIAQDAAKPAANEAAGEVVLIPNRVIYPGETIGPDALKEVTLMPGRQKPDAVATRAQQLDGKVAKRTLLPGRYIPTSAIREAWLVEQGAAVQVFFTAGTLTISATAVTLQPGAAGDLVKVRNIDSGKILSGTVMADGTIRVSAS
ncbi:flagellar basal body P-ring formation protein FlgA [Mesorhizobium sp. PAMC28654]|uniref:flagellar basal body P-ring formation chaperone FlgA n=1 Tax=Mesorhizobium sp. PAMC28654 TaxID=2880934 RepID=UPI001D09A163|nr:flagellar basal body P-ring formation protein FlgA [Mesorhizobium sp. PAMC28654]